MLAKECKDGHSKSAATCVKPQLFDVSLSAAELRGASLQQYLKTLDMLAYPGGNTFMGHFSYRCNYATQSLDIDFALIAIRKVGEPLPM